MCSCFALVVLYKTMPILKILYQIMTRKTAFVLQLSSPNYRRVTSTFHSWQFSTILNALRAESGVTPAVYYGFGEFLFRQVGLKCVHLLCFGLRCCALVWQLLVLNVLLRTFNNLIKPFHVCPVRMFYRICTVVICLRAFHIITLEEEAVMGTTVKAVLQITWALMRDSLSANLSVSFLENLIRTKNQTLFIVWPQMFSVLDDWSDSLLSIDKKTKKNVSFPAFCGITLRISCW